MVSHLLVFYVWLIVLFAIGYGITRAFRVPSTGFYPTALRNIFIGYVVAIVACSLISTVVHTINLVFILAGLLIWWEWRRSQEKEPAPATANPVRPLLITAGAAFLFFLLPWLTISNGDSYLGFYYSESDYVLYARIAESLLIHGHENGFTVLNQLDDYYNNPEPYHFFDIWGAATVSKVFQVNVFPALMVIVYPTLYLLAFLAFMAIQKAQRWWTPLWVLALLMIGGLTFSFDDAHPFFQSLSNLSYCLLSPKIYKLSYFYVFLATAWLLYRSGYQTMAIVVCASLPIANIITLPTVIPALLLWIVFRKTDRDLVVRQVVCTLLIAGSIVVFYGLNQRASAGLAGAEISKPLDLVNGILQSIDVKIARNIIVGGALSLVLLYIPYIAILVINRRRIALSGIVVLPIAIIGISLLAWAALYQELNSSQIFSNISIVVVNVFIAIVLSHVVDSIPLRTVVLCAVLMAVSIVFQLLRDAEKVGGLRNSQHGEAYLLEVERILPAGSLVGSIRSAEEMTYPFAKYNAVYALGDYLLLQGKHSFAVNIADLSTPIDSTSSMTITRSLKAVRDGIFYRYALQKDNQGISEPALMEKFLKEHSIRYLIVSKDAILPEAIQSRAARTITDDRSGERFIELM